MPDDRTMTRRKALASGRPLSVGRRPRHPDRPRPGPGAHLSGHDGGHRYFARFGSPRSSSRLPWARPSRAAASSPTSSSSTGWRTPTCSRTGGEPGLRRRQPRRGCPGRQGRPDRLRLHGGPQSEGLRLARDRGRHAQGPSRHRRRPSRHLRPAAATRCGRAGRTSAGSEAAPPPLRQREGDGRRPRVRKVRVYFVDEIGAMLLATRREDRRGPPAHDHEGLTFIAEQTGRREENYYNVAARTRCPTNAGADRPDWSASA